MLTKEHIWPNCLIDKYESLLTYSKREKKFYKGDPTVKDVCECCNNVKLSKLDSYLCALYDKHLSRIFMPGEAVTFSYDYDLLVRSLLKVSYNSARANASTKVIKAHRAFVNFVLHGGYCGHLAVRLQIVTASRRITSKQDTESLLEPKHLRCAEIAYDGPLAHRFVIRMVAINCFWFYLVIPHKMEPPHKWKEFFEGFDCWRINSGVKLSREISSLHIPVSQTTYLTPDLLGALVHPSSV